MNRIKYPPVLPGSAPEELTSAEKEVVEFLDRNLSENWEIYVHPHLNGLKPDIVLLNPNVGIAVFEVLDWTEDFFEKDDCEDYDNILRKLLYYKNCIFEMYCPILGKKAKSVKKAWGVVSIGVLAPYLASMSLDKLFSEELRKSKVYQYAAIVGREYIENEDIKKAVGASCWRSSSLMPPEAAEQLRGWLDGTGLKKTREQLLLDPTQKKWATTRTSSGYRRIKGPAGSGKTLILAARAANLANEGKKVLLVVYNVTLVNYIRSLVVCDLKNIKFINNVIFANFHGWCADVCNEYAPSDYSSIWNKRDIMYDQEDYAYIHDDLEDKLNEVVELTESLVKKYNIRYDAILVDEGQDFSPEWWSLLRQTYKSNGEMLLAADMVQDIYGKALLWTEEKMEGAGFRGEWVTLTKSYRMPEKVFKIAECFSQEFLPEKEKNEQPVNQFSLIENCSLRWIQCTSSEASKVCLAAILDMLNSVAGSDLANMQKANIALLVQKRDIGNYVIDSLRELELIYEDTVSHNRKEEREKKRVFWQKDCAVHVTTMHSFKGFEAGHLVIYVDDISHVEQRALFYVALTRLLKSHPMSYLTVVSSSLELKEFGQREFQAGYQDISNRLEAFLEPFLWKQFFRFQTLARNQSYRVCSLQSFDFKNRYPNYDDPLHQSFYFLKYAVAYTVEYFKTYERLLDSDWALDTGFSEGRRKLSVLSVGCGAMLDYVGLKYAFRELGLKNVSAYHGIDLVDWKWQELKDEPACNFHRKNITTFSHTDEDGEPLTYDIIMFPKSISELGKDILESFVHNLSEANLSDSLVVVISKRSRASQDSAAGEIFSRMLCSKFGYECTSVEKDIFEKTHRVQKFTEHLHDKVSQDIIDYVLKRTVITFEQITWTKCLQCRTTNKAVCQSVFSREPMQNVTSMHESYAFDRYERYISLNAEPEIYYLQKKG